MKIANFKVRFPHISVTIENFRNRGTEIYNISQKCPIVVNGNKVVDCKEDVGSPCMISCEWIYLYIVGDISCQFTNKRYIRPIMKCCHYSFRIVMNRSDAAILHMLNYLPNRFVKLSPKEGLVRPQASRWTLCHGKHKFRLIPWRIVVLIIIRLFSE